MRIGSYQLKNRVLLAPMAGITDQPFRRLCTYYGAGLTFSEMMSTNPQVWHTEKSKLRLAHSEANSQVLHCCNFQIWWKKSCEK